jgi:hypothetical protein
MRIANCRFVDPYFLMNRPPTTGPHNTFLLEGVKGPSELAASFRMALDLSGLHFRGTHRSVQPHFTEMPRPHNCP